MLLILDLQGCREELERTIYKHLFIIADKICRLNTSLWSMKDKTACMWYLRNKPFQHCRALNFLFPSLLLFFFPYGSPSTLHLLHPSIIPSLFCCTHTLRKSSAGCVWVMASSPQALLCPVTDGHFLPSCIFCWACGQNVLHQYESVQSLNTHYFSLSLFLQLVSLSHWLMPHDSGKLPAHILPNRSGKIV